MFSHNIRQPRPYAKDKNPQGDPFEQQLLRNSRYPTIMGRVLRRMDRASYESDFCSRSPATLAADTGASIRAVTQARQKIVALEYYERCNKWRYNQIKLPGESKRARWRRMQKDKRVDSSWR